MWGPGSNAVEASPLDDLGLMMVAALSLASRLVSTVSTRFRPAIVKDGGLMVVAKDAVNLFVDLDRIAPDDDEPSNDGGRTRIRGGDGYISGCCSRAKDHASSDHASYILRGEGGDQAMK